jgi:hypothetical protein
VFDISWFAARTSRAALIAPPKEGTSFEMRFYFDIRNGFDFELDREGRELQCADEAHREAVCAARERVANHIVRGECFEHRSFEITD